MGADGESWHPWISNTREEVVSSYEAAKAEPVFQPATSPLEDAACQAAETVDQVLGGWPSGLGVILGFGPSFGPHKSFADRRATDHRVTFLV
jgi:hypothetical protein